MRVIDNLNHLGVSIFVCNTISKQILFSHAYAATTIHYQLKGAEKLTAFIHIGLYKSVL